jgi:hypothetical protein
MVVELGEAEPSNCLSYFLLSTSVLQLEKTTYQAKYAKSLHTPSTCEVQVCSYHNIPVSATFLILISSGHINFTGLVGNLIQYTRQKL